MRTLVLIAVFGSAGEAAPVIDNPAPSWSVGGDPLLVAFSDYYEVYGAHGAGRHAAVALSMANWRSSDDPTWHKGLQLALRVPVYFFHRFEGPFLEPGVIARFADNSENTHDFEGPELLVGYQHTFDFGLTLAGAIGAAYQATTTLSYSGMTPLDGYVRVGWAF